MSRNSGKQRRAVIIVLVILVALLGIGALPFVVLDRVTSGAYPVPRLAAAEVARFTHGVIRYQDSGQGENAVLFLHAYNAHLGQWKPVWDRTHACGERRVRIDIPGFGESHWQTDDYGMTHQAARVVALLDELGISKVTLIGTSMGASLAATISALYPERVSRALLMAPSGYPNTLTYPGLFGRLIKPGILNTIGIWIARSRIYAAVFPNSRALQSLTAARSYGDSWAASLSGIRAPTLIVWSRGDQTSNPATAESVHAAIPESTLLWLDTDTGHSIPNTRPELAADLVCQFVKGVAPAEIPAQIPRSLLRPGEGAQ